MRSSRSAFRKGIAWILIFLLGCAVGAGATLYLLLGRNPPDITRVQGEHSAVSSAEPRELVDIEELPDHVVQAFVAIEDERFFDHFGIDVIGVGRAIVRNIQEGRAAEGAGTITMQVARNVVLEDRSKTLRRKLREALVALRIERIYSKEQILASYLSSIYFGAGAYGIQEASQTYFGKNAGDLEIEEAALLAALPKAPSNLSPFKNIERARQRRNLVLLNMSKLKYISEKELKRLSALPVEVVPEQSDNSA